jgi:3-methyladenine DNA glycosylase Mpg
MSITLFMFLSFLVFGFHRLAFNFSSRQRSPLQVPIRAGDPEEMLRYSEREGKKERKKESKETRGPKKAFTVRAPLRKRRQPS